LKTFLLVTAIIETATGLALIMVPVQLVALLLGPPLDTAAGLALARVAGAAILSLGVACWFARGAHNPGARGMFAAMLVYNIAVFGLLLWFRFNAGMTGIGLLPAAAAHAALAIWCIACFWNKEAK
jgi:hypothetical protein